MLTGADLPPLAWQNSEPYDQAKWRRPIDDRHGWTIKPYGGLWTAPLDDDGVTAWGRWCECEDYGNPDAPLTIVTPHADAKVYRINDLTDLLQLEAMFSVEPSGPDIQMWPKMSWAKAAADIDAVWLTAAGEARTRFSTPGLYGWDCETVLWLQPRFDTP